MRNRGVGVGVGGGAESETVLELSNVLTEEAQLHANNENKQELVGEVKTRARTQFQWAAQSLLVDHICSSILFLLTVTFLLIFTIAYFRLL